MFILFNPVFTFDLTSVLTNGFLFGILKALVKLIESRFNCFTI